LEKQVNIFKHPIANKSLRFPAQLDSAANDSSRFPAKPIDSVANDSLRFPAKPNYSIENNKNLIIKNIHII